MTVCYDAGILQAFLDGEVTGRMKTEMEEHLLSCGTCRKALDSITENQTFTGARLAGYMQALGREGFNTGEAWNRFNRTRSRGQQRKRKGAANMFSKYRMAAAAAVMVLVFSVSLSFGSVRSAASELLTIFRVEKVTTVNITPEDISRIEKAVRDGAGQVDIENFGKLEFVGQGTSGMVTPEEARSAVDFALKQPAALPDGYSLKEYYRNTGGSLNLTLDTQQANGILQALGSEKLLPEELNGKTFTVKTPVVINTRYAGPQDSSIIVSQGRSPELVAPGSDIAAIRDALLALPFLPESVRSQLASMKDWQNTFLIPNVDGSSQEVDVAGAQGVFITPPDGARTNGRELPNSLIWQKDGVVYAMSGFIAMEDALELASSMR